ncbi:MAG: thiamine pyrophosphate-binding protein [Lachnospiraceae bacterium]|nr:thiamine pyrophosphate-binding protein [Lachnospiraceae bacterium]
MKKRVADFIADYLAENGMDRIFTVTGGGAMHLNDAFGHHPALGCVYNHHEQACAMAAEGYTRLSGKTSVVCVTSGPGGTNALTGVMGAWLDSVPMIIISGQMKFETTIASTTVPLRQLGFQEFNILDAVRCMTKYCVMVKNANDIKYFLDKAKNIAENGRPGPVWLDIPLDVQGEWIKTDGLRQYDAREDAYLNVAPPTKEQINKIVRCITESKRPLLLAGNGIRSAHAQDLFLRLVEKYHIPAVTAWNAHDLMHDDNPYFAGRPGTIGTRGGNFAVQNCDLLISLGCRMNIRQISYEWQNFARNAYKIAVDIDEGELRKPTLSTDYPIHADVRDLMLGLLYADFEADERHKEWVDYTQEINRRYPVVLDEYKKCESPVNPYVFMEELSARLGGSDAVVASNGTACVCGLQVINMKDDMRMFTNAGASSMGYGLPAAIGACMADRKRKIICLEGDGSIQMNLQELQTVVHHNLNMKIVWLNNDGYHSIRQTQAQSFDGENRGYCGVSHESGISFPDAGKIADAYGIKFYKIDRLATMGEVLAQFLEGEGPALCEVVLDKAQFFAPKLSSRVNEDGTITSPSLEDMFPFLAREEIAGNMIAEK